MRNQIPHFKKQAAVQEQVALSRLIDDYIESLADWQRVIAQKLREIVKTVRPKLTEDVKWGFPCYTAGGKCICSFMAMKETVNFVLYYGAELDDPGDLIEGTGKSMRHVKLRSVKDIRKPAFTKFIQESVKLVKKTLK